ncbi:CvfB family protein [Poseidonibacter antarcticus]|uniref:CvfB family protein n=1 Tax=Poseidonibacter antarcticus TaxID=2478538 RepID=UPI000EF46F91|nr:S1-like domain-containing RNA-binding protein [Poseidonibacter antarcticus]
MNEHIYVGEINKLAVYRKSEPGLYLVSDDREEVLLPNAYVTNEMELGSFLDVFIYTDSEDRLVATTLDPYLYVNEFAYLEIVDTAAFGAFVDIGLPKDILVPKNKQRSIFHKGHSKVLKMILDEKTDRLICTEKYTLEQNIKNLEEKDEVEILVYSKTPLGYKVIVNDLYDGMIFHTEIFENVYFGDRKRAYIKKIRDDNKLDISLQEIGKKIKDDKVLEILKQKGGKMDFTYKSDAEDIKKVFGISKKAFKATLTKLLNEDKIVLESNCIKIK